MPGDAVMLKLSERTIVALDADGHEVKTLVTVPAGREVTDASLTADHRTIWYAARPLDNQSCPEIVKLDLVTNASTVVAHASDFTLTPDDSKLVLVFPKNDAAVRANCGASEPHQYDDALVVRNLATGAQSTLPFDAYPSAGTGGPSGPVWISPSGDRLVDGNCVEDGCAMFDFTVPVDLAGPIVRVRATTSPMCGCASIISGADGIYGIDRGGFAAPQTRLRGYTAAHLKGTGTVLVESKTVKLFLAVPTTAGLFVVGGPGASRTANLYRVDGDALHLVTTLASPYPAFFTVRPLSPFAAK